MKSLKGVMNRILPPLAHLDISHTKQGVDTAHALSKILVANTTLRSLILYGNGFGVEGASMIAQALRSNHTLRHLDLGANRIRNKGAKALAGSIFVSKVEVLAIKNNFINEKGFRDFSQHIREIVGPMSEITLHLKALLLGGNEISLYDYSFIEKVIKDRGVNLYIDGLDRVVFNNDSSLFLSGLKPRMTKDSIVSTANAKIGNCIVANVKIRNGQAKKKTKKGQKNHFAMIKFDNHHSMASAVRITKDLGSAE